MEESAPTIVTESGLFNPDAIERQLAHTEKNLILAAYHRAETSKSGTG